MHKPAYSSYPFWHHEWRFAVTTMLESARGVSFRKRKRKKDRKSGYLLVFWNTELDRKQTVGLFKRNMCFWRFLDIYVVHRANAHAEVHFDLFMLLFDCSITVAFPCWRSFVAFLLRTVTAESPRKSGNHRRRVIHSLNLLSCQHDRRRFGSRFVIITENK